MISQVCDIHSLHSVVDIGDLWSLDLKILFIIFLFLGLNVFEILLFRRRPYSEWPYHIQLVSYVVAYVLPTIFWAVYNLLSLSVHLITGLTETFEQG